MEANLSLSLFAFAFRLSRLAGTCCLESHARQQACQERLGRADALKRAEASLSSQINYGSPAGSHFNLIRSIIRCALANLFYLRSELSEPSRVEPASIIILIIIIIIIITATSELKQPELADNREEAPT